MGVAGENERAARRELGRIARRLGFAFEQAVCGMVVLDREGHFQLVNAAMAAMLGRTEADLKRLTFLDITHPDDVAMGERYLADAQSGAVDGLVNREKRYVRPDGSVVWVLVQIRVLRGATGEPFGHFAQVLDVTALKSAELALADLARRDPVSGQYNRLAFMEAGERRMRATAGLPACLVVIYADVDGFKQVNDEAGHVVGDAALAAVGAALAGALREADVVARIGGDEFAALCVVRREADAAALLAHVRAALAGLNVAGRDVAVSSGAACCSAARPRTLDELLAEADAAMYEQKRARRLALAAPRDAANRA